MPIVVDNICNNHKVKESVIS